MPTLLTWPNHNKPGGIHNRVVTKSQDFSYFYERIDANLTVASRGLSNESVGAKITRNRSFFHQVSVSPAPAESFFYGSNWDPTTERGVPWD